MVLTISAPRISKAFKDRLLFCVIYWWFDARIMT
jgi:hypothetical protein